MTVSGISAKPGEITVTIQQTVRPNYFVISKEQLHIQAEKYLKCQDKIWVASLTSLLTLFTVLLTANFKDYLVPRDVWTGIFIAFTIVSLIITVIYFYKWYRNRMQIDDFVNICYEISVSEPLENN